MSPRRAIPFAAAAVLALAALLAGGCNIVAPVAYIVQGPPRTPALYEPPDRPTLVFVDDRANTIPRNADAIRRLVADTASRRLMTEKVITTTIRPQDAIALAKQHDRHESVLPIDEIGRLVGAEQVIYIRMLAFRETADGTPRPYAAAQVKVIDVVEQVRLYPPPEAQEDAFPLQVTMHPIDPALYQSRSALNEIHEALAAELGASLARLFFSHETEELGGRLGSR